MMSSDLLTACTDFQEQQAFLKCLRLVFINHLKSMHLQQVLLRGDHLLQYQQDCFMKWMMQRVEGVIAHEVAHVANGDMVTMTLLQGIVNTFVVFLSRIAAWIASRFVSREELVPIVHFIAVIVFQIIFSILGSLVVFAYSRHREFHADRGGADLAGKDKMIHALRSLEAYTSRIKDDDQTAVATLKISGKRKASLFSTHPDLNERIRRLEAK